MLAYIALLTFSLVAITIIDMPRLIRRKLWRELWVYSLILAAGYSLAFKQVSGVIHP